MIDFFNPNNTSRIFFELDPTLPDVELLVELLIRDEQESEDTGNVVFALEIPANIASFIYLENQFKDVTGEEVSYQEIFGNDFYEKMKTHQEALKSVDILEKTPASGLKDDFVIYEPTDFVHIFSSLNNYLERMLWHTERSCLYWNRGMIYYLHAISRLCEKQETLIRMLGAC